MKDAGYEVAYKLLNSKNFNVPQDRKRVIIVGYREDIGGLFQFPTGNNKILTFRDAIYDLRLIEPVKAGSKVDENSCYVPNYEYIDIGFSSIYLSRNRVRNWSEVAVLALCVDCKLRDEPSFTIQTGGRHAPIHPQANKMLFVAKDKWIFDPNSPLAYRRLSVRECARIQTFSNIIIFKYNDIADDYKMVGNAVPVNMAKMIASIIFADIQEYKDNGYCSNLRASGYLGQLTLIDAN